MTTAKKTTSRTRRASATTKKVATSNGSASEDRVVLEMTIVSPKKGSVRFDSDDPDAVLRSVYVNKPFVDDDTAGVRITIEKL